MPRMRWVKYVPDAGASSVRSLPRLAGRRIGAAESEHATI
ncbi:hypothetical protein B8V81_1637 [Paenibacillus pasadenensis]|uniref:Uncharacterized protein n=1 Tax=Paenibacillus pasadenensis TaxID=217090 RepID=A0A2N5NAR3_9BACL|nr:hypothetical protein B8V81_1637 [Paenibacillus pasadenensis]